jgi:hypothetical protein
MLELEHRRKVGFLSVKANFAVESQNNGNEQGCTAAGEKGCVYMLQSSKNFTRFPVTSNL